MPKMTGAQALVRSPAREGVEVVFALPGVQIIEVPIPNPLPPFQIPPPRVERPSG